MDLENETGEALIPRLHHATVRGSRAGRRGNAHEGIEHLLHPEVVECAAEEHGGDPAGTVSFKVQCIVHPIDQFHIVAQQVRCILADLHIQSGVVQIVEVQAAAFHFRLHALEKLQVAIEQIVHPLKGGTDADGPAERPHLDAELFLQFIEQVVRIAPFEVHLVDEHDNRRVAHAAHFHEAFGLRFNAFHAIDHQHHAVHGRQRAVGVLREIAVTGCIQQVDALARVVEGHHRGADADSALPLDVHEIARGPFADLVALHCASRLDGTAVEQELLGERGLASIRMADDGERASLLDLGLQGHVRCTVFATGAHCYAAFGGKSARK